MCSVEEIPECVYLNQSLGQSNLVVFHKGPLTMLIRLDSPRGFREAALFAQAPPDQLPPHLLVPATICSIAACKNVIQDPPSSSSVSLSSPTSSSFSFSSFGAGRGSNGSGSGAGPSGFGFGSSSRS